jgi:hypothetical protein
MEFHFGGIQQEQIFLFFHTVQHDSNSSHK